MTSFTHFDTVGPMPSTSIERWGSQVPEAVLDLWQTVGVGLIGADGFVRVIDPAWYADLLPDWFTNAEDAVPFLATGMGDLFIWKPPIIRHALYRSLEVRGIAPEFESLWPLLEDPAYLDLHLDRGDYPAGVQRLGTPTARQAFFYAPFLALGGAPGPENLDRGELSVTGCARRSVRI